ncbi:MAG: SpoIIE family protein phosphatase [Candidatus Wallbacteria bacterium]|nr:SpoIIE family protein phosphatase [Candidatus Wallbacteria bacterium]
MENNFARVKDLKTSIQKISRIHHFHQELNYCYTAKDAQYLLFKTLNELYNPAYIFFVIRETNFVYIINSSLSDESTLYYFNIFKSELKTYLGEVPAGSEERIPKEGDTEREVIQSSFTIPIRCENQNLGMLSLGHLQFSFFSEEDIELVVLLCDNLAHKLKNILLREELNRKNHELVELNQQLSKKVSKLSTLHSISREIGSSLSSDEICSMVLHTLNATPGISAVIDNFSILAANHPEQKQLILDTESSKKPFFLADQSQEKNQIIACLPLPQSGTSGEMILVSALESGIVLPQDEREFIELLSQQVTQSLLKARYYEDSRKLNLEQELKLATFFNLSEILSSLFNTGELLKKMVEIINRIMPVESCSLMLVEKDKLVIKAALGLPEELIGKSMLKIGEEISGWVAATGQELLVQDIESDKLFKKISIQKYLTGSLIAVPVRTQKAVIGVINVNNKKNGEPFTESDLRLLKTLASTLALVVENSALYQEHLEKQNLEEQLKIAWNIQQSCLPKGPLPGFTDSLAADSLPAKIVGGDYYDYFELGPDRIALTIADVSGKGIPAALLMIMLRTILRVLNLPALSASKVLSSINKLLVADIDPYHFITMQYAIIDYKASKIRISNAGHEPLLIFHRDSGAVEEILLEGVPLGIGSNYEFKETELPLNRGDLLVFYTDGVTETLNPEKKFWQRENLKIAVKKYAGLPVSGILDNIISELRCYGGNGPQHDDLTLLIFKV